MHLPVSLFCFYQILTSCRVLFVCTHPKYFLAFLEIRQKVNYLIITLIPLRISSDP